MSMTPETASHAAGSILIIGGYGMVGRSIAERLAPSYPNRVIVAGRNQDKAKTCAASIGHGTAGLGIDIFSKTSAAAPEGTILVVVCLDQNDTGFVEHCLARGIHYVDISADYAFLSRVEALDGQARRSGATAMLSVGVAPGLTNLLAARACSTMTRVDGIDIFVKVGLGDRHGETALSWIFDNLDAVYEVRENGRSRSVRSFGECRRIRFPGERNMRSAYRFNFSDQHVLRRTLDVPATATWLCFDNSVATWMFAALSRAGLGNLLHRPRWRAAAIWLFMNIHIGSDICAVAVRVKGRTISGGRIVELGLVGRKEALMTAIIAAESVKQVLSGESGPGVFHSEQGIALTPIIAALAAEQPDIIVSL